jgi:glycosyltransferase involved in cell wall biosynthesis
MTPETLDARPAAAAWNGKPSILVEAHNLVLPTGTGIATYARVLQSTLVSLGHRVDALVGAPRALKVKDPLLAEVTFYDAPRGPTALRGLPAAISALTVSPFAKRPTVLPRAGAVVDAATSRLAAFGTVYAMPHLMPVERSYFMRYGGPIRLDLPERPRLFHATRPAPLKVPGCPNIYTIHDIVPLRVPYATADDKRYFLDLTRHLCAKADHIVTVSEFSRQDIMALTGMPGDRITNTYQSVTLPARLTGRSESEVARELSGLFDLDYRGYFLFVGALEPKKNVGRLLDAYSSAGVTRPLVLAGGLGWMYDTDVQMIRDERFLTYEMAGATIRPKRRVKQLQYLPFQQLVTLMQGARALLFPSVYEGFGLPVLEAMLLGTPVMTSNVTSLPEIVGDAALAVDPYSIDAMATAIRALDADDDLVADLARRGRLQAAKFTPEAYGERLTALYAKLGV